MDTNGLANTLRERLAVLLDRDESTITGQTPFAEIDLDSIMLLELVALVEQRLGFELPESDWARLTTIDDVVVYVAEFNAS